MATPEPTATSHRLRSAARAERVRLRRELDRYDRRILRLRRELADLEQSANGIRQQLTLLAQLAHDEEDSPFPTKTRRLSPVELQSNTGDVVPPHGYLRGADIRIAAVRVLAASEDPSRPIHYGDWYRLVADAGYGIVGRDPLASFLTQIGRSPLVNRAGAPGLYALDLRAPRELRERLHTLHQELASIHEGQQTIEEIATVATRRAELTSAVVKVERELEEAVASLGLDPNEQRTQQTAVPELPPE
jgi:uncharacterized protein YhaN